MKGRVTRYASQVSPERCMVWTEPSRKHRIHRQRGSMVPVVYYLSKDNRLEHPHFIEDLAEDDLIMPAKGNDYILKGSLLLDQVADGLNKNSNYLGFHKEQSLPFSPSCRASPHPLGNDTSLLCHQSSITVMDSSRSGACRVLMPSGAFDASTQTEDRGGKKAHEPSTQTTLVLTDYWLPETNPNVVQLKDVQAIGSTKEENFQTSMPWNAGMGTLVSLIRAEVEKLDSIKGIEEKGLYQSKVKIKRANAILQLITCGSILKSINIS